MTELTPHKRALGQRLFRLIQQYVDDTSVNPVLCQVEFEELMHNEFTERELEEISNPYAVLDYFTLLDKGLLKTCTDNIVLRIAAEEYELYRKNKK
jgi:hypothetical protein